MGHEQFILGGPPPVSVLLVDDQPPNLLALEATLADVGAVLVRAESGAVALRRLLERDFALILLDVQMPDLDGYETARLIRSRERSRSTPIIFVTAHAVSHDGLQGAYEIGAIDYLFKPIDADILRSKVAFFVELFRKSQELEVLTRRYELILRAAGDGIMELDPEGRIQFANPAAAQILARDPSGIIGRSVHEILHQNQTAHECRTGACTVGELLGRTRAALSEWIFRPDGSKFQAELTIHELPSSDDWRGSVLTFRDVTERVLAQLASENRRLYEESQLANRAKDEFLATLSHELRTPMTAILGWVRMLRMDDLDDATVHAAIDAIEKSTSVQAQLIEDMLDVSRIIAGKLHLHFEEIRLDTVVRRAVEALRPLAVEQQLGFRTQIEEGLGVVWGDPSRIQQIVWNLVSNAIKFTPTGGVVTVSLTGNAESAILTVRDSGRGIDRSFLPHVFDRFRQEDATHTRAQGGLGLGLAIVRYLVEAHGGTVTARSEGLGSGAEFSVQLPLGLADTSAQSGDDTLVGRRAAAQRARSKLAGRRVLLVDDDAGALDLFRTVLGRSGALVFAARSVHEAIGLFVSERPHVIVTDIVLPNQDGFALFDQVRGFERRRGRHVPVIAVTGRAQEGDVQRIKGAGFDAYLLKPVDPVDLLSSVAAVLENDR